MFIYYLTSDGFRMFCIGLFNGFKGRIRETLYNTSDMLKQKKPCDFHRNSKNHLANFVGKWW